MTFYPVALLEKYCTFKGRASRCEFWMHYLYITLFYILYFGVLYIAITYYNYDSWSICVPVTVCVFIFLAIPTMAVSARRVHDLNLPGWFGLLIFFMATFIVYYGMMMVRGTKGPNRYGADPLDFD